MEFHKLFAADVDGHIELHRLAQGRKEIEICSEEQQEEVVKAWKSICSLDTVLHQDLGLVSSNSTSRSEGFDAV